MEFTKLVKALLVEERGHTPENAERLVASYPSVITNGMMRGFGSYRATAIALEMKDEETDDE